LRRKWVIAAFCGTTSRLMTPKLQIGNERSLQGFHENLLCTGYFQAYNTAYKNDMEDAIRACAKDCFVLTSVSFSLNSQEVPLRP
jgi:hypothetical protein